MRRVHVLAQIYTETYIPGIMNTMNKSMVNNLFRTAAKSHMCVGWVPEYGSSPTSCIGFDQSTIHYGARKSVNTTIAYGAAQP